MYNLTAINASGILPLIQTVNSNYALGGLGTILLIVIFAIAMYSFTLYHNDIVQNWTVSSFALALFSTFFMVFQLTTGYVVFIAWSMFAIGMMVWVFTK